MTDDQFAKLAGLLATKRKRRVSDYLHMGGSLLTIVAVLIGWLWWVFKQSSSIQVLERQTQAIHQSLVKDNATLMGVRDKLNALADHVCPKCSLPNDPPPLEGPPEEAR